MATNATEEVEEVTLDTTVDDLRKAKEESETNPVTEEPTSSEEESTKEEQSPVEEEAPAESDTTLTTEPQESEHDLDWYKKAYEESTKEALRLKGLVDAPPAPELTTPAVETEGVTLTPEQLYIKQKQDEETAEAFGKIQEDYPQVKDKAEYDKFVNMAQTIGKNIVDAEKRLPPPREVYAKAAVLLGWTAGDNQEKLASALKSGASSTRVSSATPQGSVTSKVSDAMISANRKMYPGKSDAEIREELEPYVQ